MLSAAPIKETTQIKDIEGESHIPGTWVVLDLDNTTHETTTEFGGDQWFAALFKHASEIPIDNAEKAKLIILIYNAVQHHVSAKPVDPQVVKSIQSLQAKGKTVLALTARGHNIIEPTMRQMREINVDFSKSGFAQDAMVFLGKINNYPIYFHKGIIFCSGQDKGECLHLFIERLDKALHPKKVLMADDKRHHLENVHKKLHHKGIHFQGLHYTFLDPKIARFDLKATTQELVQLKPKLSAEAIKVIDQLKLIPFNANANAAASASASAAPADVKQSTAMVVDQLYRANPNEMPVTTAAPSASAYAAAASLPTLVITEEENDSDDEEPNPPAKKMRK